MQEWGGCHDFTESTKGFFQNVCAVEAQRDRKAEHSSFPSIFSYWMPFKVSECFTLGAFIPYFKRNSSLDGITLIFTLETPLQYLPGNTAFIFCRLLLYYPHFLVGCLLPRPFPNQVLGVGYLGWCITIWGNLLYILLWEVDLYITLLPKNEAELTWSTRLTPRIPSLGNCGI